MRRVLAVLFSFVLVATACGSDSDGITFSDGDASADASDTGSDDGGGDSESESSMFGDSDDDAQSTSVSRIEDIPQVCRDLMEQFLKDIEPIVSQIDWDNATMSDFEAIAPEFEQLADEFDIATDAQQQCDDLDIDDDDNLDLVVEFAREVAPGTVGFMTFISDLAASAGAFTGDDETPNLGGGDAAFDDCAGAIAWMEGLMAQYDSMAEAPLNELMQFADIATVIMTCTPEQAEFFDSPEVAEFFSGL